MRRSFSQAHLIRGLRVLLDNDLAELYGVSVKRPNEQVRRNRDRFPEDFMFQLSASELEHLRSQIATSNGRGGRRYLPFAFTEQGVAMLSSVLSSDRAVKVNIEIMRAFVALRQAAVGSKDFAQRLDDLEAKFSAYDAKFKAVFEAIRQLGAPSLAVQRRKIGFRW